MPALNPVPNIGSQVERAIIAWLYAAFGGAQPLGSFYFSNDWKQRVPPLIDVFAHKSTEEVRHSRIESYAVKIEAKWTGANQPGAANPSANWKSINDFIGVVMAAMSQTDDGGETYRAAAWQIAQAGRRLAVLGTAAVTGASAADIANNADMASFFCDYLEFKGSQRGAIDEGTILVVEIRNFEIHACNLDVADDSIFPILAFDGANTLNWTFTAGVFAEPAHWLVEKSVDGLNWLTQTALASGARSEDISGTGTQYWRVRRSDDGVDGIDPESNLVKATV